MVTGSSCHCLLSQRRSPQFHPPLPLQPATTRPEMTNVAPLIPAYNPNTLVPYFRKKTTYKLLAQYLTFSSGTTSRPMSVRDCAHTSSRRRRPLHFVAPLNLTPSLESWMYQKKWRGRNASVADREILAASQAYGPACDPVPGTL